MNIDYHKDFKKDYKKLSKKIQEKFDERILRFQNDQFEPILNNHALTGKYSGYRSINITGDLRALYKKEGENITFMIIVHIVICMANTSDPETGQHLWRDTAEGGGSG